MWIHVTPEMIYENGILPLCFPSPKTKPTAIMKKLSQSSNRGSVYKVPNQDFWKLPRTQKTK